MSTNHVTPYGKYSLLRRISVGGMAEVYQGVYRGVDGDIPVAIKRILPDLAENDDFVKMFLDEARISVRLEHPNLIRTHELGRCEGQYYLAMEYLPSRELRNYMDRSFRAGHRFSYPQAALIVAQLCDGLSYAHGLRNEKGRKLDIIHRDISPQNILVGFDGSVKIIDFGIARARDREYKTEAGILKGKFAYMAPEQVKGKKLTQSVDIFAAGVVLYELCTGARAFKGQNDLDTLERIREVRFRAPEGIRPDIPQGLVHIINKALSKSPRRRFSSAAEMAEALRSLFTLEKPEVLAKARQEHLEHIQNVFASEVSEERERERALVQTLRSMRLVTRDGSGEIFLRRQEDIESYVDGNLNHDEERTIVFERAQTFFEASNGNEPVNDFSGAADRRVQVNISGRSVVPMPVGATHDQHRVFETRSADERSEKWYPNSLGDDASTEPTPHLNLDRPRKQRTQTVSEVVIVEDHGGTGSSDVAANNVGKSPDLPTKRERHRYQPVLVATLVLACVFAFVLLSLLSE